MKLTNSTYSIQGLPLAEIALQFGLPLYLYDAARIVSQAERLKAAFSGTRVRLKYAMKALTNPAVLKILREVGVGLDAVSWEEVQIGLLAGFAPEEIMFTTSCVHFPEIEQAARRGVLVNLDSLSALEKWGKLCADLPVCLRLNPDIRAGGNAKIQTGHKESKFGIPLDQLPEVKSLLAQYKLKLVGLHIHTGSDILDPATFIEGAQVIFRAAAQFSDLRFLDLGGGFKVPYQPGDKTLNVEELGAKVSQAFNSFCQDYGRELELWFEPGKFLVSEAGLLLVETTVIKKSGEITFVGVNSGLNHLIRPMMYGAYHHVLNVSNPTGIEKKYTVVGYICETDTFGSDLAIAEVREGDILAIKNAGAYGYTMSSNYNSKPRPAEVLVENGKARLISRRETFEDVVSHYVL